MLMAAQDTSIFQAIQTLRQQVLTVGLVMAWQEMKAAESRRAHALAVEVAELKQQLAALQAPDDKSPSSLSQCTPRRSTSDGGSLQVGLARPASSEG